MLLSVLGSEQRGGHVIRRLQQEVQKQAIKVIRSKLLIMIRMRLFNFYHGESMGDNYQDQKDLFFVVTSFYQNMLLLFNCYLSLYLSKIISLNLLSSIV